MFFLLYSNFRICTQRFDTPLDEETREQAAELYEGENDRTIYDRYEFDVHRQATGLPIEAEKRKILHTIANNTVTVLRGKTGYFKSLRYSMFILIIYLFYYFNDDSL